MEGVACLKSVRVSVEIWTEAECFRQSSSYRERQLSSQRIGRRLLIPFNNGSALAAPVATAGCR